MEPLFSRFINVPLEAAHHENVKSGDALTITFDKAITALQQLDVKTWLEKPEEAVTFRVTMGRLADGTSKPATIVL